MIEEHKLRPFRGRLLQLGRQEIFFSASDLARIDACKLLNFGTRLLPIRMTAYDYAPPIPRSVLDGYLAGTVHYNFFIATKTPDARGDLVPQQNFYQGLWDGKAPVAGGAARRI